MRLSSSFASFFYVLSACVLSVLGNTKRLNCTSDLRASWPTNRVNTTQKLIWLRNEMNRATSVRGPTLDAFIVTFHDEHQGEFLAERDKRLQYISGFSGPYGFAVVTRTKAAFWTDFRYYDQADEQLDCNWMLMKLGETGVPSLMEWIRSELKPGYRVGGDPKLIPFGIWDEWNRDLSSARIALIETYNNLIDLTWTIGRPLYNGHSAFILPSEYAGDTWQNKVAQLRMNLTRLECDAVVITALEEIAWLLNVRGRDVPYGPFVRSYLIVGKSDLHWYVPPEKLGGDSGIGVKRQLKVELFGPFTVRVHAYDSFFTGIRTLSQIWRKVLIPSSSVFSTGASQAVYSAVPPDKRLIKPSPVIYMKAKKNPVEIEGMRRANVRDSAAFIHFLTVLDEQFRNGSNVSEMSIVKTLEKSRLDQNISQGIPFPTIAAFGTNGALFHYELSNATDTEVNSSSILTIHGGGHYYDGTSDMTRSFHFGRPTEEMIDVYTYLLSGLIQFSTGTFPSSVKTTDLDVTLRSKLWKYGINYKHDTGHGLGAFSNVKESPILISYDAKQHKQTLKEGYFLTCEPGFLKPNEYGIKLGNVLEVVQHTNFNDVESKYLGFKDVTLVPFETKLIDSAKLSREEIIWINEYHERVMNEVGEELKKQNKMKAFQFLKQKTKPISYDCSSSKSSNNSISIFSIFTIVILSALRFS